MHCKQEGDTKLHWTWKTVKGSLPDISEFQELLHFSEEGAKATKHRRLKKQKQRYEDESSASLESSDTEWESNERMRRKGHLERKRMLR